MPASRGGGTGGCAASHSALSTRILPAPIPTINGLTTYDRLWSNLPFLRPLVTITDDSLADYGIDEHGGRLHDLLGTRCDPYVNKMLTGEDFHHHCHSNLTRAVLPHGLTEFDVHDRIDHPGESPQADPEPDFFVALKKLHVPRINRIT